MSDIAELEMIRDSARAIVPPGGDLSRVRTLRFTEPGFDRETFTRMADLGWLMLRLPEAQGGLGLGMDAYVALARVLGSGCVPEPLIHALLALRLAGDQAGERVLSGEEILLPAWQEAMDGLDADGAMRIVNGRASGEKRFILNAAGADAFVITAAGQLALVRKTGEGVSLTLEQTQDGGNYGRLTLKDAPVELLETPASEVEFALNEAALATAAYLQGGAETAFETTLDYLRVRQQFDRPIGSFQALQHRATELKLQLELCRAAVDRAVALMDSGAEPAVLSAAVSQAKARASDVALMVGKEAIQMHGAIGFTDEHDVGLYVRKAMVLANHFGSAGFHRRRFAAVLPYAPAA